MVSSATFSRRCAVLAALLFAVSAQAQPNAPQLTAGQTMDGSLSRSDPTLNDRGRFKVFRIEARAGQRYSVVMRADDLDSYLSVARMVNGMSDYFATDDDGAGSGSNAKLKFTAPTNGTYFIVAQSLAKETVGAFTVRMDELPAQRAIAPVRLSLNTPLSGELVDTDMEVPDGGQYYRLYTVIGRAGQRIAIEMTSTDFDSYLSIGQMVGDSLSEMANDDDGMGENNARLRFTPKEDGIYTVRARSVGVNSTGSFSLKAYERPAVTSTTLPIAAAPISGSLAETDPEADDGTYYDQYKFTVRAGEKVTVTQRSDDFDSYLVLGRMTDGNFEQMETDDDGAGGNHSKIEHTFDSAGEYVIRANSVGVKTGRYTVRLQRGAGAAAGAPGTTRRRP